jgi:hypothetical protein
MIAPAVKGVAVKKIAPIAARHPASEIIGARQRRTSSN